MEFPYLVAWLFGALGTCGAALAVVALWQGYRLLAKADGGLAHDIEAPGVTPAQAFVFMGHFEGYGPEVWAGCDHAPVFASGDSENSALSHVEDALAAYLEMLSQYDEIDAAVRAGKLVRVEIPRWLPPGKRTKRVDQGRFEALLPAA